MAAATPSTRASLPRPSWKPLGGTAARSREKDFADYSAEWVDPISTTYRGWTVYELPPNGQGIAALEMLNIMETFPAPEVRRQLRRHAARHDRGEKASLCRSGPHTSATPNFPRCPSSSCFPRISPRSAPSRSIPNKANCNVGPGSLQPGSETIYLSVVDRDGNMVSLIQSNFEDFGSGIVREGTGFVLHNRGALFTLDPQFAQCSRAA